MATTNYQFPTITSEDTINGVTAINGLAEAVDTALKKVDDKASGGEAYVLPPATTSTLGGVIVGDNLTVGKPTNFLLPQLPPLAALSRALASTSLSTARFRSTRPGLSPRLTTRLKPIWRATTRRAPHGARSTRAASFRQRRLKSCLPPITIFPPS